MSILLSFIQWSISSLTPNLLVPLMFRVVIRSSLPSVYFVVVTMGSEAELLLIFPCVFAEPKCLCLCLVLLLSKLLLVLLSAILAKLLSPLFVFLFLICFIRLARSSWSPQVAGNRG